MADATTEVGVEVQIAEATASINQLKESFTQFSTHVTEQFDHLSKTLDSLTGKVSSIIKMFLSFEGAKHGIEVLKEMAGEANKLGAQLGIGRAEAGVFAMAIESVGMSVDSVSSIMMKQGRQLKQNEAQMNEIGVATRDANGHLLSQKDILYNSIEILKEYKEGTDRNQAAMYLFGSRVGDINKLLKLNADVEAEAKVKADALGLTLSDQSLSAVAKYKKAFIEVGEVMKALWKVIGDAIMPLFSDVAEWFADMGPAAVQVFSIAVKSIVTVLDVLWLTLKSVIDVLAGFVRIAAVSLATIGGIIAGFAKDGWAGAKKAWADGAQSISDEDDRLHARLAKNGEDFQKRFADRWGPQTYTKGPSGGDKAFKAPTGPAEVDTSAIDNAIMLEHKRLEMVKEVYKGEADAKRITKEQSLEMDRVATEESYQLERQLMFDKANLYKADSKEYAKILDQILALDAQHGVEITKNQVEIAAAERKTQAEKVAREVEALKSQSALIDEGLKLETAYLDNQIALGLMTAAKKLEIEKQLLQQTYAAKLLYAQKEADLYDPVTQAKEKQKALEAIDKLTAQHNISIMKNETATVVGIQKEWESLVSPITTAFGNMAKGIAMGTQTLKAGMKNLFSSILGEFINMIGTMMTKWAALEAWKLMTTKAGSVERAALDQATTWTAILNAKLESLGLIKAASAVGGANAAASTAAIPVVGPAMAPAAGAAMAAEIMGFEAWASAARGYDIPAGVNPITQLHSREMVLPAAQADVIRDMAGGGGGSGGGAFHYHDYTGTLSDATIQANSRKIAKAMGMQARNFYKGA